MEEKIKITVSYYIDEKIRPLDNTLLALSRGLIETSLICDKNDYIIIKNTLNLFFSSK